MEESLRCLKLLYLVLRSAAPNIELAHLILQEADLSFREAYHMVRVVVRRAMDAGLLTHQIDAGCAKAHSCSRAAFASTRPLVGSVSSDI
nr:hypothetical protein [Pseudomonas sp. 58 R 12]